MKFLNNLNDKMSLELNDKETKEASDVTQETYAYNCLMCKIIFTDLKLFKQHFLDTHKAELYNDGLIQETQRETRNRKTLLATTDITDDPNNATAKPTKTPKGKKRKLADDDNESISSKQSDDASIKTEKIFDYEVNEEELTKLSDEQLESFNFDNTDEKQYFELNKNLDYSKERDLLAGKVAWAYWRHNMWPAMIERVVKDKSGYLKVHIRYYEMNQKLGNLFPLHASKVDLFFKTPNHFHYKNSSAISEANRKKFYVSYTNALRDYIALNYNEDLVKSKLKSETQIDINENEMDSDAKSSQKEKSTTKPKKNFCVLGKTYSLEEIKKLANQEYSTELLEEFDCREKASKLLMETLKSDECKQFLVSILSGERKCERHEAYLVADSRNRRRLRYEYVGPLVSDDQIELAKYLKQLSEQYFKEKPANLTNYEYDVLYPEAVIWALMKKEKMTYKKAELKCRQGFKLTHEELIKSKCNDILNRQSGCLDNDDDNEKSNEQQNNDDTFDDFNMNGDDTSFFAYNLVEENNLVLEENDNKLNDDANCEVQNVDGSLNEDAQKEENCDDGEKNDGEKSEGETKEDVRGDNLNGAEENVSNCVENDENKIHETKMEDNMICT